MSFPGFSFPGWAHREINVLLYKAAAFNPFVLLTVTIPGSMHLWGPTILPWALACALWEASRWPGLQQRSQL